MKDPAEKQIGTHFGSAMIDTRALPDILEMQCAFIHMGMFVLDATEAMNHNQQPRPDVLCVREELREKLERGKYTMIETLPSGLD